MSKSDDQADTLGKRLRMLRAKSKMTQEALARDINVTLKTIVRLESDQHGARRELLKKLALKFGVSEDWLADGPRMEAGSSAAAMIAQNPYWLGFTQTPEAQRADPSEIACVAEMATRLNGIPSTMALLHLLAAAQSGSDASGGATGSPAILPPPMTHTRSTLDEDVWSAWLHSAEARRATEVQRQEVRRRARATFIADGSAVTSEVLDQILADVRTPPTVAVPAPKYRKKKPEFTSTAKRAKK